MQDAGCPKYADYRSVIIDIAMEDTSCHEPAVVDEVRRHVRACPSCQAELETYQRIVNALRLPPIPNEDEVVAQIAANVRRNVLAKVAAWERRRRILHCVGALAAVAAVVIAGVALWPAGRVRKPPIGKAVAQPPAPPHKKQHTPAATVPHAPEAPAGTPREASRPRMGTKPEAPRRPKYESPEGARVRALSRIERALYDAERARRKKPLQYDTKTSRCAVEEARKLIRGAPATTQARKARYYLFRHLQLLGEAELAELEFENYIGQVAVVEGAQAACKVLLEEGVRERCAKSYLLALKRFRSILSFDREGERAAVAYVQIGNVHSRLHQRELAEPAFRKAIDLGAPPAHARLCYHYLINVALGSRDHGQALRDAKALVELPGSEAAKANDQAMLGMAVEKTEGPMKAAQHYRQILSKYPPKYCATARWRLKELERKLEDAILDPVR